MKRGKVIFLGLVLALVIAVLYLFIPPFTGEVYNAENVPEFKEIPINFQPQHSGISAPFVGSAIIDINGDRSFEIFIGGGQGQEDVLFSYKDETFTNIIEGTGLSDLAATHGVISLDINEDDQVDLIVARENGLFIYTNNRGVFSKKEIELNIEENTIPFSVAPGDINNDGWVDLYISTTIHPSKFRPSTYNDPEHARDNILLLNNGDNTFTDITEEAGVAVKQNTFLAAFVDLNDDGKQDLVVSPNTDKIHIFENVDGKRFEEINLPGGYGAWMGIAIDDYDNDGDPDLFLSNMGRFVPKQFLRGDLRDDQQLDTDWALLENKGNLEFEQVNLQKGLTNKEFAWGAVFADFNLDGRSDLLVAENYVKWIGHYVHKYPGRFFIQDEMGNFIPVIRQAKLENKNFGQSPLIIDLNNDGYPDVIYININSPIKALLNQDSGNNYLKVIMPDGVDSLGAKVTVKIEEKILTKYFIPGIGFLSDQSPELIFGLGKYDGEVSVVVEWSSGEVETLVAQANNKITFLRK